MIALERGRARAKETSSINRYETVGKCTTEQRAYIFVRFAEPEWRILRGCWWSGGWRAGRSQKQQPQDDDSITFYARTLCVCVDDVITKRRPSTKGLGEKRALRAIKTSPTSKGPYVVMRSRSRVRDRCGRKREREEQLCCISHPRVVCPRGPRVNWNNVR